MREIKRAKLSSPTTGHGSPSSEPTPSGSSAPVRPDPDPSEASSNDEGSVHSESENERGASGSPSDEYVSDFDSEKVQDIFDDWVASLPLQSRKMLDVMLMETLQKRTNIKSTPAALEAAWITCSMKRLFVVTENNSLRITALSEMSQEESISDSASSARKLYASKQPCAFERMR